MLPTAICKHQETKRGLLQRVGITTQRVASWIFEPEMRDSSRTCQGSTRKYCLWGTHTRWSTENLSSESSWAQTWLWYLLSGCLCKIYFTSLRVSLIYEMEIIVPSSKMYGWGFCELGCSVAKLCATLRPHELQHARFPYLSVSPGVCFNWWTLISACSINAAAAAKSLQSCPTLCDPIDGSPPGSPIPGILQARTLEWVASSFSNAWKWKVKVKMLSRVWLLATPWTAAYQAPPSMGLSR